MPSDPDSRVEPPSLEAERRFEAGAFDEALAIWERVAASDASPASAQARIGACLVALGRFDDAVPVLAAVATAVPDHPVVRYRLAVARAGSGDDEGGLDALEAAAANGLRAILGIDDEPAFARLRSHPRFQATRERIARNEAPAMDDEACRRFDFWVGTWEARTEDGVLQGINRIERALGGAVLIERWTGASGYRGMSLNRYDPRTGTWRQTWIDDQGDSIEFVDGIATDGRLEFQAVDPDGGRRRLTFVASGPDALRQLAERSADGTSWSTEYDFRYRRLPDEPVSA
jgi:hypothetical protein